MDRLSTASNPEEVFNQVEPTATVLSDSFLEENAAPNTAPLFSVSSGHPIQETIAPLDYVSVPPADPVAMLEQSIQAIVLEISNVLSDPVAMRVGYDRLQRLNKQLQAYTQSLTIIKKMNVLGASDKDIKESFSAQAYSGQSRGPTSQVQRFPA